MIVPNLRASFGRRETEFLIGSLAERTGRGRDLWAGQLAEEGLDALLDHPEALPAVMESGGIGAVPAPLAFYLMVRRALLEAGLDDMRIADYVASLLVEFGENGRAYRIARYDDRSYRYLVDLVADLEEENSRRRQFLLRAHLGNYSLWLAGLFPDYVVARVHRRGAPGLDYYEGLGTTGFRLASECDLAARLDLTDVYLEVADGFREVRRALNSLSDRYFFPVAERYVEELLRELIDDYEVN